MIVIKFGGTSVANAKRIEGIASIISDLKKRNKKIGVVVSAFSGVTDELIRMSRMASVRNEEYINVFREIRERHQQAVKELHLHGDKKLHHFLEETFASLHDILHGVYLVKELSQRTLDFLSGHGEVLSARIIATYLQSKKISSEFLDARNVIRTDENFGSARVNFITTNKNIVDAFRKSKDVVVITGFVASTAKGEMTTLGRGGSDYTAAIFGAALDAKEIQIWTDVDGVMTADPRKVRKAFSIKAMTYEEAMEMSHFGAKVIHPPTIQPALDKRIPLLIKNTFKPEHEGTFISFKSTDPSYLIKGISSIDKISLLTLQGSGMVGVAGISARLFGALSQSKINVILITQGSSEHTICFAVKPEDSLKAQHAIEEAFHLEMRAKMIEKIRVENDLSIIAVIGENMRHTPGVSGRLFQALGKNGISIVATAQGSSELNISTVIRHANLDKAMNALHQAFFLSDVKTLSVFLVGTGLIGGTLIKQIALHRDYLRKSRSLEIVVAGIANSRKMIFNADGLSLLKYADALDKSEERMILDDFIQRMKDLNLTQSIFVDCTSDEKIANAYDHILRNSISIVTPNKIANSGNQKRYERLRENARKGNVRFMYETNVGAGLPVINTLNDLMSSGDRIIRIEAVLSGTLSFIFNNYLAGTSFSNIVREAKKRGYTEPDPRIDLSGKDVARKLLILARETGIQMELDDIKIKQLLPVSCMRAKNVEDFFHELKKNDDYFEQIRKRAADKNKVLRFIAKLEDGKATISLQEIDNNHPFYNLSGSDNIISFTTERYNERPLVVKGPGAGAEVTAAEVSQKSLALLNTSNDENKITVFAPATVANLGCGFDSMGLAIEAPGDELTVEKNVLGKLRIMKISGDGKKLSADPKKNTVTVAIQALLDSLEINKGFDIYLKKKMPLGSGLGSSAASAVAGAFAVNQLLGGPYTKKELVRFAMAGEKVASGSEHADNVAPSLLGGIVLIRSYHPLEVISLPVPSKLTVIVVHPNVEVLTKSARAILPKQIPLTDAIAQWSNTAALTKALYTDDYALIGRSVTDRIAEPRRAKLIPNFENVKHAAILNGALACSISGSGPSVFALCEGRKRAKKIANAMMKEFTAKKIKSISYISHVNQRGVIII